MAMIGRLDDAEVAGQDRARIRRSVGHWELANEPPGQDPALLLKQEGAPMLSVDLTTRDCGAAVADRDRVVIVELARLTSIDAGGYFSRPAPGHMTPAITMA